MKGGRGREEQVIAEARFYIVMVWWQAMVLYLVKQTNKQTTGGLGRLLQSSAVHPGDTRKGSKMIVNTIRWMQPIRLT